MATDRSQSSPSSRLHGRVPGDRPCSAPGCEEAGEFRVPGARRPGFDGPGDWRWMCLEHVREYNARYNFFQGMSPEEIARAQSPLSGWERETRAFSGTAGTTPRWSDFADPMDALGAHFGKHKNGAAAPGPPLSPADQQALRTLGLKAGADRKAIRAAYANLLRRYHPDRNGGDRQHEKALQAVIEAYTHLSRAATPTA